MEIPEGIQLQAQDYYFGSGYDFYYSTDIGLYGYTAGMEDGEFLLNWQNSNILMDELNAFTILAPDTILISSSNAVSMLKKAPDIDLSSLTVIDIAMEELSSDLSRFIVKFNRTSDKMRVVSTDYSIYNTREDYNGGINRLLNDILNGNYKPDLVVSRPDSIVMSTMMDRGLYTDLYSFMETDEKVRKDDLMGIIKNTYEIDGKLPVMVTSFTLTTLLAPKSFVGERTSWTLDEMLDAALSLEDGKYLMSDVTQNSAANVLLGSSSYSMFVDMKNGTCDFESPTFIKYLNYIKTLPESRDAYNEIINRENRYEECQTGKVMLYQQRYRSIDNFMKDAVVFNSEDFVRIGYPAVKGNGSYILPSMLYLIPSSSENPAEAWGFLREMILARTEDLIGGGFFESFFPLRSQNLKIGDPLKDMHWFYFFNGGSRSWSGEYELDENGRLDGKPGILRDWDQAEYEAFLDWLDTIGVPAYNLVNAEVDAIINEEVSAYLADARSVEDTAKIIQSRVSLWLAEHS